MPTLHAVTAYHYKSFEPQARLELRPLTLLLGRNNAGKSSLLRLLPHPRALHLRGALSITL